MPGIPLLTKFSDVVGAVTPVASEVISLLLVEILQFPHGHLGGGSSLRTKE